MVTWSFTLQSTVLYTEVPFSPAPVLPTVRQIKQMTVLSVICFQSPTLSEFRIQCLYSIVFHKFYSVQNVFVSFIYYFSNK